MEDFLRYLISPLLSHPENLQIIAQGSTIVLKVDDADVGRIIGKQGNVINALRTLLKTYCSAHKLVFVNLLLQSPPLPGQTPKA
jgi:uncharacterized protein